jgi:hypothetical protein
LDLLRILSQIGGNSTRRILLFIKPLDIVSKNRIERFSPQLDIKGDTSSREVEGLEKNGNGGEDRNDKKPSTDISPYLYQTG